MATYTTLRASSKSTDDGFVITPSGTATSVLSDSSESTYIRKPNSSNAYSIKFNVADPSSVIPPTGSFLVGQRLRCRASQGSGGLLSLFAGTTLNGLSYDVGVGFPATIALPSTLATVSSASRASTGIITVTTAAAHGLAVNDLILIQGSSTGSPLGFVNASYRVLTVGSSTTFTAQDIRGSQSASLVNATNGNISYASNMDGAWLSVASLATTGSTAQSLVNNSTFTLTDSGAAANRATIYEAYFEVLTSPIPTVSSILVDGASTGGVVTSTSRPLVEWTYAQSDGYAQSKYRVKVFTTSQTDPENTATVPLWDSGVVTSTSASATLGADMINSTTYYVYVKAGTIGLSTDVSSKYDASIAWSNWVSATVSTSFTAPTAPSVSLSWGSTQQRVRATLTGGALTAPMTAQTFDLQRSDDGGTTWYFVRNGVSKTPSSFVATVDDFEMKRGTTVYYRARSVATGGGSTIYSQWGSSATVVVPALTDWTFRSLNSSGEVAIAKSVTVYQSLSVEQKESIGTFRPIGRASTVVVHGDLTGDDGTYSVFCSTQAAFDSLLAVINGQKLVLVADPYGENKYIRVTARSWSKRGSASAPRYDVSITYVEVESGLVANS